MFESSFVVSSGTILDFERHTLKLTIVNFYMAKLYIGTHLIKLIVVL